MKSLGWIKTSAALLGACVSLGFVYALGRAPVFEKGTGYEFYCGTSSAEIVVSEDPALTKFLRPDVKGECAYYEGNCYGELKERFHAKLLFSERLSGIVNYYLYSPDLGGGVEIGGKRVNLHIAVGGGRTAAGTPLIFGGF